MKKRNPTFSSEDDAELERQRLEEQTNIEYIVVKNRLRNEYYIRKKRIYENKNK